MNTDQDGRPEPAIETDQSSAVPGHIARVHASVPAAADGVNDEVAPLAARVEAEIAASAPASSEAVAAAEDVGANPDVADTPAAEEETDSASDNGDDQGPDDDPATVPAHLARLSAGEGAAAQEAADSPQLPSIGRIVHLRSALGAPDEPIAGIITAVHGGMDISVTAFPPNAPLAHVVASYEVRSSDAPQGVAWSWPPRV